MAWVLQALLYSEPCNHSCIVSRELYRYDARGRGKHYVRFNVTECEQQCFADSKEDIRHVTRQGQGFNTPQPGAVARATGNLATT